MTHDFRTKAANWFEASTARQNIACALIGALLSILISGFVFAEGNNIFHLPIVAALYDLPQYEGDVFMQSLRHFSSGIWMVLAGSDSIIPAHITFFIGMVLSRLLMFAGFLTCAEFLGVRSFKDKIFLTLFLCIMRVLYFPSFAGGGGIFISNFTHSEIANGLTLLSIAYMMKGRAALSFGLNGAVFFTNAFVAVWNFVPLGFLLLWQIMSKNVTFAKAAGQTAVGAVVFILFACPVLYNIIGNPSWGQPPEFNYKDFLWFYWPYHFLFESITLKEAIKAALVLAAAIVSFVALGKAGKPFLIILSGYMAVYGLGMIVPHFTDSSTILNLHLLRVSTFFHIFMALGFTVILLQWKNSAAAQDRNLWMPGGIILCVTPNIFILPAFYILANKIPLITKIANMAPGKVQFYLGRLALLAAAVIFMVVWAGNYQAKQIQKEQIAAYAKVAQWAHDNTAEDSIFLLPSQNIGPDTPPNPDMRNTQSVIFDYTAQRRTFVDFKRGAAVMWYPAYYKTWRADVDDILKLQNLQDYLSYAKTRDIDYVVFSCGSGNIKPVYEYNDLCVYKP